MSLQNSRKNIHIKRFMRFVDAFKSNKMGVFGFYIIIFFVIVAFIGPLVYEYDPQSFGEGDLIAPPNSEFPLGTDDMGRDILGAIIYGAKVSLVIGVFATLISVFIGTLIGVVSGFVGGTIDILLMRFTDGFMVLPKLPLIMILAAFLGSSTRNIIIVLGFTSWTGTARLVRSQTLSIKERPFIERAIAVGAGKSYIMIWHILPNVFPIVFSNTILVTAVAILTETTLSFLGLGNPMVPSWGQILRGAFTSGAVSLGAWWFFVPAGMCVIILVLGFTFLGYSFDEILNPKLRGR
ncbi:MAG: ABC transporter permease [Clostridiales bacterium]|nr:MAG: ABC transporter permease [Clostridiales bacterium]